MKPSMFAAVLLGIAALCAASFAGAESVPANPPQPEFGEYKNWRVIGISHRLDKKLVRVILGNDIAIQAARSGKTKSWPDGTILAKVGWKESSHPNWPQAVVPGEFAGAEAMVKDSKKYAQTGGWGFGHWVADRLEMHDQEKSATCFACHTPMKDADYVYTVPAMK